MKRTIWLIASLSVCNFAIHAQQFQKKMVMQIDESLSALQMELIALDSDTLLDVALTGVSKEGQLKIQTFKNVEGKSLQWKSSQLTGYKSGSIQTHDWNGDNAPDILIAGKTLINTDALFVFGNTYNFTFSKAAAKLISHSSLFRVADMNQDGKSDLLFSGTENNQSFFKILTSAGTEWLTLFNINSIQVTDAIIFDFNNDQKNDFILTGLNASGRPVMTLYLCKSATEYVATELEEPVNGKVSIADVDSDGSFDFLAVGKDAAGQWMNKVWLNKRDGIHLSKSLAAVSPQLLFTGDFNSDGQIDQLIQGKNLDGTNSNVMVNSDFAKTELYGTGLLVERMGDFDRDGDLDLVQVIDSIGAQWIKVFDNTSLSNTRPAFPTDSFALSAFSKTFIFWDDAQDDHTAIPSLTYDVWLGTSESMKVVPSFNLGSMRRTQVRHGNAGTNTFFTIRELTDDRYYYLIQSVDNAFNGSYGTFNGSSGFCGGSVLPCFDLKHEVMQVCKDEKIVFSATTSEARWYSTGKKSLGKGSSINYVASENDTLFLYVPQGKDCAKNKVWVISVHGSSYSEKETIYACKGKTIQLGISPGWKNIEWKTIPIVNEKDSIDFVVNQSQSIVVTASTSGNCTYQKEFIVKISEPQMELNGEQFQVLKGNPVQLSVTGTVEHFLWTPPFGLNDATISNPIATPIETIEYIVTGTDSVECSLQKKVRIQVEQTAFVPNLFTPNNDGKNDALLVFGLTQAAGFKFQIFNRQGNLVYETTDVSEATTRGWNGSVKGTKQPSGVYYWKIEGTSNEDRLLLNGKKTGSILLIN
jgi:gliding motility-associated-like protein